ncbi:hypothetical protein D3874_04925 [Oleomonas cavernae]|uniref:Uncharacterized protein n=1 Tax=Oleomonas cavernae TaxID=2320859 RepID=A0A418W8U5_9PROT|nr:hypothetical protein [Oleomonas cavernae]RJF86451.1 hypothetical protein D3874_04925 [Oleomonas cavernae]
MAGALKSRGFVVDLFYYVMDGVDALSIEGMREEWDSVHATGLQGYVFRRRFPEFWGIDDWIAPSALTLARRLSETRSYDLVLVNYVWCSGLFEPFVGGQQNWSSMPMMLSGIGTT